MTAGPFEDIGRDDLPAWLCAFTADVLRAEAAHEPGWFDVVHSHYWLSGQVGGSPPPAAGACRWSTPSHTLAKVKNASLADGDRPEPLRASSASSRSIEAADRLVASTADERRHLVQLYDADPDAGRRGRARRRPRRLPTRATATSRPRGAGSASPRTPRCCCSSAASSH